VQARVQVLTTRMLQPVRRRCDRWNRCGVARRLSTAREIGRHEVVDALPPKLLSKDGARRSVCGMERSAAQPARGLQLPTGPWHLVVQAEHFGDAVAQEGRRRVERCKAAYIDAPDVAAWMATCEPLCGEDARASGVRNAGRVEARRDKESAALGCLAKDVPEYNSVGNDG
jgi:hypothetical protein